MTEEELMLTSVLNCRRIDLFVDRPSLRADQQERHEDMKTRRAQGEPLQYILGECDFMGIKLAVDQNVLIPRPETEILVDLTLQKLALMQEQTNRPLRILDLGTGSGSIAIALAKNMARCMVTATDISPDALTLARNNARVNGVADRIDFILADTFNLNTPRGSVFRSAFDLIISNPPYIPTTQLFYLPADVQREPRLALDGGGDGLRFYRHIIAHGYKFLNKGGFLFMEIGDGQKDSLDEIFKKYPEYHDIIFHKDYTGVYRVVAVQI